MSGKHERVTELFNEASKLEPADRRRFLEDRCDDPELRSEVLSLLEHTADVPEILAPGAVASIINRDSAPRDGRIGSYQLRKRLGDGAMGIVYLAEQQEPIRRSVAIKVLKLGIDTEEVIARFESERRALAMMDHAHIARVYDAGTTDEGRPYFAMEHVDGRPVVEYCDTQRLTIGGRIELFLQICEGVQHAHQKGIIHRDLKPSNVLVKVEDGRPVPKIIDFGIAKATQERLTARTLHTAVGMLIGTPGYMSPEQAALDASDVDTRTDVYSLGVILYELIAGVLPFGLGGPETLSFDEIRRRIREEEPRRPSEHPGGPGARQIDADLDWITLKALEKDRERRYASVAELAADLRRHLRDEPVLAGPPSAAYRARKLVRRHRGKVLAAGMVLATLLLGLSGTTFGLMQAVEARDRAGREARLANDITEFLLSVFESTPANRMRHTTPDEVLSKGVERIESELAGRPELQAMLMHKIGKLQLNMGLRAPSERLLESARAQLEAALGLEHPETLRAMASLARAHVSLHRNIEAEALYLETLERQRKTLGPLDPDTLATLHELAFMYKTLGRQEEAARRFEEAYAGRLRVLGAGDPETLLSLGLLGSVYLDLDRLGECRATLLEALARMEVDEHAEMGNVLYNLGCVAARTGDRTQAFDYLRRAIEHDTGGPLVGDPHLASMQGTPEMDRLLQSRSYSQDFGKRARDQGFTLVVQGRYAEAEPLLAGGVENLERRLGPDHPDAVFSAGLLGDLYMRQGRYAEAEPLVRRYAVWLEREFGPHFFELGYVLWYVAQCRAAVGDTEAAIEMLERAAAILERTGFPAEAALRRASAYGFRGEHEEALRSLRVALVSGEITSEMVRRDLAFRRLRGLTEFAEILGALPREEPRIAG